MFRPQPTPYGMSFAAGATGSYSDFPVGSDLASSYHQQQSQLALLGLALHPDSGSQLSLGGGGCGSAGAQRPRLLPTTATGYSAPHAAFGSVPIPLHQLVQAHNGHPQAHHHAQLQQQQQQQQQQLQHHGQPPAHSSLFPHAPPPDTFHSHLHNNHQPQHHSASPRPTIKMEAGSQDDLAAQEAAAREYQPHLKGALVGSKTTAHAITEEYARADPVYVEKTIALPQTYSHFRPIRGDGNCGWRAIGFAYFETLALAATPAKIQAEIDRIRSLNQFLQDVGGYNAFVWEDMVEETLNILRNILDSLGDPNAAVAALEAKFNDPSSAISALEAKFNDPEVSSAVVYHLRLLAASYLKGHPQEYEPFTPGGIQAYCSGTIEPTDREIDHLGITLLVEVLLRPAGFLLEIVYLDRTAGTKANTYRFPAEATGQDEAALGPFIHLLFRPDHYDILYRKPLAPTNIQINRAASFQEHLQVAPSDIPPCAGPIDFDILTLLPGYALAPGNAMDPRMGIGLSSAPYTSSPEAPPPPAWAVPPFPEPLAIRGAPAPLISPIPNISDTHHHHQLPQQLPRQQPQQHHEHEPRQRPRQPSPTTNPLRFSKYSFPTRKADGLTDIKPVEEQAHAFAAASEQQTMTTAAFRQSHYNVAHFNNPNFQPEEYRPADDDLSEGNGPSSKRKKKERTPRTQHPED